MLFPVRLHDAVDTETVLRRLLPVLAGHKGERRVAYAEYDASRGVLVRRWTLVEGGTVDEAAIELEPARLHSLLMDDAGGDRPLRPADSAPVWVLRDLIPGLDPERAWIRVRAIAHDGAMMGVLLVSETRRFSLTRKTDDGSVPAAGDVLEMALARARALRESPALLDGGAPAGLADSVVERLKESERAIADARAEVERTRERVEALERAAGGATELLMDAHVELDRRAGRHQRQTRVIFLLRKLLGCSPVSWPGRSSAPWPRRSAGAAARCCWCTGRTASTSCGWAPPWGCLPRWTRISCGFRWAPAFPDRWRTHAPRSSCATRTRATGRR
jgi:hypothetical protein